MCHIRKCTIGLIVFFKQKTAYELRISAWSSDVCSSDLAPKGQVGFRFEGFDCEATSGVGVVFGSSTRQDQVRLREAPVDQAWLEQAIVWTDAADTDGPDDDGDYLRPPRADGALREAPLSRCRSPRSATRPLVSPRPDE